MRLESSSLNQRTGKNQLSISFLDGFQACSNEKKENDVLKAMIPLKYESKSPPSPSSGR